MQDYPGIRIASLNPKFCLFPPSQLIKESDMKATRTALAAFLLAAALLTLLPFPALSQQPSGQGTEAPAEMQLRSFAKAYVKVEKIREVYESQLSATPDAQEAREIEQEAMSKIGEVIVQEGLTLDSFNQIVQTANANDDLRKKIVALINEEKKKS
jgi:Domain of unknown function (DUF4168)